MSEQTPVLVRNVSKTFKDVKALDDVNLQLDSHKIYGLLGRNGAGKTTLMSILTGQGFPDAGEKAQVTQIIFPQRFDADFHHHSDRGRCRIPDRHVLILQDAIPTLVIKIRFIDDAGEAVGEGGDDPVGCAGHPSGIGSAPKNIAGMEIEGQLARHVMGHHGIVHVNGALRCPGRAAGEMEECDVFGISRLDSILFRGFP